MKYGIYYAYWEKQWGGDYVRYPAKVAELGFDILEISCAGMKDMTMGQVGDLYSAAVDSGIMLSGNYGPKPDEDITSTDPKVVENAFEFWRVTLSALEWLHIPFVAGALYSYWPVDYSKKIDKEADWERSVLGMRRLAAMAREHGVTLGMEVLNRFEGYIMNTAEEAVAYVKDVGEPNVKVMLDTFHMNIEEDSMTDAIKTAGSYLGHIHAGEANRRPPRDGGRFDWREIGQALREIGYDGTIVMEPFVMPGGQVGSDIKVWRDLVADSSEAALDREAAASVKFLREALGGPAHYF
ncbi:MAG: sugar phosphate isomerase/epimerase [Oscillospiraceae bacterium]|nr:sugar phosphate isomerase/epimerase [Oscillospiraceae bacterium]